MARLFSKTKELEAQIDAFLNAVSEGNLVFKDGVRYYLEQKPEQFDEQLEAVVTLEARADELRREVEVQLYSHSLIPEHRGDVLALLENMDDVIDKAKETLMQFSVENPAIPDELNYDYLDLVAKAVDAAEAVVLAAKAFFRDVAQTHDHLHKVYLFEKDADKISDRLKRHVFDLNFDLSRKIQLRYFANSIDQVADRAEEVADRLRIYAIKRSI